MNNSRILIFFLSVCATFCSVQSSSYAAVDDSVMKALKTIDPNLLQYFPRWRICEPNLLVQIKQTFILYGRPADKLDLQNIVVTAAPKNDPEDNYTILLIECGDEAFVASEVDAYMKKLSQQISDPKRPYCFREIPRATPPSERQYRIITNYLMPTDVKHSISISAFEQSLKIGESGFWIRSVLGTDQIGYHFWSSGESRVLLQRPLYDNDDPETSKPIPYLINTHLGVGYRLRGGLSNRLLSFLPERRLNSVPGKVVAGLDIHFPGYAVAGISFNAEVPVGGIDSTNPAEKNVWAMQATPEIRKSSLRTSGATAPRVDENNIIPVLRTSAQLGGFFNYWLDPKKPENYFRLDVGINYVEIQEWVFRERTRNSKDTVLVSNAPGLRLYHPTEFADWVYARLEYRNQSTFPFGVTVQYANNMLFARAYLPLVGEWLYLEGKYSTPLRKAENARPWEIKNLFVVSPVLRLNIR